MATQVQLREVLAQLRAKASVDLAVTVLNKVNPLQHELGKLRRLTQLHDGIHDVRSSGDTDEGVLVQRLCRAAVSRKLVEQRSELTDEATA
ncbi:hypothetical protein D3C79_931800 [compost metagenome]